MASPDSDSPRRKRIAVIAVHGVADQQPDETANTAANLLLHMQNDGASSRYHGFKTHRLRIAHRPVKLNKIAPSVENPTDQSDPGGSSKRRASSIPRDPSEKCQHQFLCGQLEKYAEPDPAATYETIRNEGVRGGDAPGSERDVHIYEMYWADLSRLGNSFLTFFVELYQLLFHLCTVGAKTARFAREQHSEIWWWRAFSGCIHFASVLIRLAVPIANLFVVAIIALSATDQISHSEPVVRTLVIAVVSIIVGGFAAWGLRKGVPPLFWPCVLFASIAIVIGLWFLGHSYLPGKCVPLLLSAEVWSLLLGLLYLVIQAYNRRHPGALKLYVALAALTTVLLGYFAIFEGADVYNVCKRSAVLLLWGVGIAWALAILSAGAGWISGGLALRRTNAASKPRAHRAIFTANLTTALAGTVMLILNITLWGLIPALLKTSVPGKYHVIQQLADDMQRHLKEQTILPGMFTLVILMALAALWMVWALIPAVRSEITTPRPEAASSLWIGKSLTNAFRVMRWAGYVAMACFGGLLALLPLLEIVRPITDLDNRFPSLFRYLVRWDKPTADALFIGFSGTVLLLLIAPFFLKGVFVKLSAGFRQGLDVALDVINYLRENPADSTIRAQIFARYVSLLRYVCNWKSPIDGSGYDGIVIFAHSQGSIITVDLLRFLKDEPDLELKNFLGPPDPETPNANMPDRIRLFTMGCPLRQLYGLRFPHIYSWARHDGTSLSPPPDDPPPKQPPDPIPNPDAPRPPYALPKNQLPDPTRLLSVTQWVNAYRSGDYVGRNLWRSEKDDNTYDPNPKAVSEDQDKKRREFCIGGGAHTHYWDKTAPTIVAELDRLIASDPRDEEPTADNGSTSR